MQETTACCSDTTGEGVQSGCVFVCALLVDLHNKRACLLCVLLCRDNQARTFFRLDSSRSARIWEVLCAAGWLKDNHPDEAEDKRRGPRAKKEAQLQLQQQQSMTLAAAASLAVGFPPSTNSDGSKSVSVAEAAAAAAAVLGLPVPAALAAESGGEGLASEATGATNSDAMVADMDDDDDFMP